MAVRGSVGGDDVIMNSSLSCPALFPGGRGRGLFFFCRPAAWCVDLVGLFRPLSIETLNGMEVKWPAMRVVVARRGRRG